MTEPIVVVAAHADDEVLGCGGALARMAKQGHQVHVVFLADGETSRHAKANDDASLGKVIGRRAAAEAACSILGCTSVQIHDFADNRLDGVEMLDIVKHIENFLARHRPSVVFTHHAGDVNIDHRIVHDAVIAACRPQPSQTVKQLLFFEVPSSTEWRPASSAIAFQPNWFVDISSTLECKLKALDVYQAELRPFPHPRSIEAVRALAKWRGATVGVKAAEAFVLGRKLV